MGVTGPRVSSLQDGAPSNPVGVALKRGHLSILRVAQSFAFRPPGRRNGRFNVRLEITYAVFAETGSLPSVGSQRAVVKAHREPLREQLRRGVASPQQHYKATGDARLREHAWPRHQRAEA